MALINVLRVARRRYQLQHTAIEFVFKGSGGSALYRFQSARDCELVWRHLSAQHADERREWEKVCAAWQAGAISNYHYLMFLNGMGDRSENDLSQYPVMPWVLADYASETINLDDAGIYRDPHGQWERSTSRVLPALSDGTTRWSGRGTCTGHITRHRRMCSTTWSGLLRSEPAPPRRALRCCGSDLCFFGKDLACLQRGE